MKKEMGKWLMNIAKCITTAVILTSVFAEVQEKTIVIILSALAVFLTLGFGLYLVNDDAQSQKK